MARNKGRCGCDDEFEGMAPFGKDEDFGSLYRSRPYGLVPNMDSTEQRIMDARSGSTGWRGTKPSFGSEGYGDDSVQVGVGHEGLWFKGDSVTAVALAGIGLAAVIFSR